MDDPGLRYIYDKKTRRYAHVITKAKMLLVAVPDVAAFDESGKAYLSAIRERGPHLTRMPQHLLIPDSATCCFRRTGKADAASTIMRR